MKKGQLVLKIILFVIIFGGSIFLLFFNPKLKINKWKINGAVLSDEQKIEKLLEIEMGRMWGPFYRDNFFVAFFRKSRLSNILKEHFPEIKKANIYPDWDNNPFNCFKLSIEEREKEGIWCGESAGCFYYDDTGFLFRQSAESKGPFMVSIKDSASLNLSLGSVLGNENFVLNLRELYESFSGVPSVAIDETEVINLNYDFMVKTNNEWLLYFDPNISAKTQTEVFKGLLVEEKIKINEPLQYIDLRIKNKAYLMR